VGKTVHGLWWIAAGLVISTFLVSCGSVATNRIAVNRVNHRSNANSARSVHNGANVSGFHWQLTWDDEFNGQGFPPGWIPLTGGGEDGWSHQELQWNAAGNARLDGTGQLVIAANRGGDGQVCWNGPCQYTSARIQTQGKFSQTYGLFEARIKLPAGYGLWPAFWLEGANIDKVGWPRCGEIDVIEFSDHRQRLVAGYAHAAGHSHNAYYEANEPLTAGYHVYGIEWTPSGITWLFDGRPYSYMKSYPGWPFDHPFFLILDLAVGGAFPGAPDSSTHFPSKMVVDWVRVYRKVT